MLDGEGAIRRMMSMGSVNRLKGAKCKMKSAKWGDTLHFALFILHFALQASWVSCCDPHYMDAWTQEISP
jgi:hypothetical protein